MALDGKAVLLLANTGTPGSPVWSSVAQQTAATLESSRNLIDASSKDSDHTKWLYGLKNDTMTLAAMYVPGDVAMAALKNAMDTGATILVRRSENGQQVEQAEALVGSLNKAWPNNDNSTVNVNLQLNSSFTAV